MKNLLCTLAIFFAVVSTMASQESADLEQKVNETNSQLQACNENSACKLKVLNKKIYFQYRSINQMVGDYIAALPEEQQSLEFVDKAVDTIRTLAQHLSKVESEYLKTRDLIEQLEESRKYYDGINLSIEITKLSLLEKLSQYLEYETQTVNEIIAAANG